MRTHPPQDGALNINERQPAKYRGSTVTGTNRDEPDHDQSLESFPLARPCRRRRVTVRRHPAPPKWLNSVQQESTPWDGIGSELYRTYEASEDANN